MNWAPKWASGPLSWLFLAGLLAVAALAGYFAAPSARETRSDDKIEKGVEKSIKAANSGRTIDLIKCGELKARASAPAQAPQPRAESNAAGAGSNATGAGSNAAGAGNPQVAPRPRISEAGQEYLGQLCDSLLALQVDVAERLPPLEKRPGYPALILTALLSALLGGLAGWTASRRSSRAPAPAPNDDPKTQPDFRSLVDRINDLTARDQQALNAYKTLRERVDDLQTRLETRNSSESSARQMRDEWSTPSPPPATDRTGSIPADDSRSLYSFEKHSEPPFAAKADPERVPPQPSVRVEDLFPDAEAMMADYRALLARTVVTPSDFESTLGRHGELATVALEDGQLSIASASGPGDVEKKLVAVVEPGRERAILFPSRSYHKNFGMSFADRSQAGQDVVVAFELLVDGSGRLTYLAPAIVRIRADNSLIVESKGRLGGYVG